MPSAEVPPDPSLWLYAVRVGLRHTECAFYFDAAALKICCGAVTLLWAGRATRP